jgi:asparagine synthase (glutamine-hydrolysing)
MQPEKPHNWAGDFLLLINAAFGEPPARDGSSWHSAYQTPGCCLYLSPPSANWRGAPLEHWEAGSVLYWRFGEVWGKCQNGNPADWPGHFLLIGFDQVNKSWHIWTNRCGTFHAYYVKTHTGVALSSFSPALTDFTERQLDYEALTGFFTFGFFPQDRTFFKGLKITPPSTQLVVDQVGKQVQQNRLWSWSHTPNANISFDDAVDAFAALFHQVIHEQVHDRRVALPISGGLDSRSTIAALKNNQDNTHVWAYSYGYSKDSVETKIASQIAALTSLPFESFTIQPYLFDQLPLVIDCIEGFQDLTQTRQAYITHDLAQHADFVIAAHLGDLWLGDMGYPTTHQLSPPENVAEYAWKKWARKGGLWLTDFIFRDVGATNQPDSFLRDSLNSDLNQLNHLQDPDFRLKALKIETYVFRWSLASLRMYQPGAFPLLPFFDPRFYDFFSTIPTSYVAGRRLQVAYLKRYAPGLARVPWQAYYDANLYEYPHFNTWLLPRRTLNKLGRLLAGRQVIQRNWELQFLNPYGRQGLQDWLLTPGLKLHDFIPKSKLAEFLMDFYAAPGAANGYAASMLLTFSAWLESYG